MGYLILRYILKNLTQTSNYINTTLQSFLDSLTFRGALGVVIGARLFDIIFYQGLSSFKANPLSILYAWEGGLASHGGVLGLIAALWLYLRKFDVKLKKIVFDSLVIPSAVIAFFIRIGNFINQEILGTFCSYPWGVVFGHPMDSSESFPRHPVQLYEAFFYLFNAIFFAALIKKNRLKLGEGKALGLYLISIFFFRLVIEKFKEEQSQLLFASPLSMGQLLSIPFIIYGIVLYARGFKRAPLNDKRAGNRG